MIQETARALAEGLNVSGTRASQRSIQKEHADIGSDWPGRDNSNIAKPESGFSAEDPE
jgi:hypothetical protein